MGYNAARRHRGLQYQRPEPECWQFTVETTDINQTFAVNINTGTDVDITIDWDDGCPPVNYTTTGVKSCTYPAAGTYYPKITGSITGGNIQLGSSADDRPRLKATGVIGGVVGLANFTTTFYGCTGLTSLPVDLFRYNTLVAASGFYGTFKGCTGLTSVPANLFRYSTAVSDFGFNQTFSGCTGLTSLPADLFRYNTAVRTGGFYKAFYGCTGLTSLPVDLFRYNTLVESSGFDQTFYGCTGLASLPANLFRYNTAVSDFGFHQTFNGCTALTSLPTDLFKYNTLVANYGFNGTFNGCTGLTSVPEGLFRYNTAVGEGGFSLTFYGCNDLTLNAWIFYASGEEATRFASPVPVQNFNGCFRLSGAFGGIKGTAPALWDCAFNGTPTKNNCFAGHSTYSVDNYGDIPVAWA
ncbi:MAG: hypothetical protein WC262_12055 [Bacteroidales bacterium]|jgi:hypothetical protein